MFEWTVQDHLTAVIAKFDVSSRSRLVATLFFDHYTPLHVADARRPVGRGRQARSGRQPRPAKPVTVEEADTTFRVYHGDQLLTEAIRTTTKTIARFKVRQLGRGP
jgi:hypothetical protein